MNTTSRYVAAAAVALAAAVLTLACQSSVPGPSLSATVQGLTLQPTVSGVDGGANVCCCQIAGQVKNTSSVTAHIQLTFPAKDAAGASVGLAADIERDVPSNSLRSFVAAGIQAACNNIKLSQIDADKQVRVFGLWEPPQ
jgi:hypothetical protein